MAVSNTDAVDTKGMGQETTIQVDGEEKTVEDRTSNGELIDPICSARCKRHWRKSGSRAFA